MERIKLIERIVKHADDAAPGTPAMADDANPLIVAYRRFPRVRALVNGSGTDTFEDLRTHRTTATTVNRIIRYLATGR